MARINARSPLSFVIGSRLSVGVAHIALLAMLRSAGHIHDNPVMYALADPVE